MMPIRSTAALLSSSPLDDERERREAMAQKNGFEIAVISQMAPWLRDLMLFFLAENDQDGMLMPNLFQDQRLRRKKERAYWQQMHRRLMEQVYLQVFAHTLIHVYAAKESIGIVRRVLDIHIERIQEAIRFLPPATSAAVMLTHKKKLLELEQQREQIVSIEKTDLPRWEQELRSNPPPQQKNLEEMQANVSATIARVPLLDRAYKALKFGLEGAAWATRGLSRYFHNVAGRIGPAVQSISPIARAFRGLQVGSSATQGAVTADIDAQVRASADLAVQNLHRRMNTDSSVRKPEPPSGPLPDADSAA